MENIEEKEMTVEFFFSLCETMLGRLLNKKEKVLILGQGW